MSVSELGSEVKRSTFLTGLEFVLGIGTGILDWGLKFDAWDPWLLLEPDCCVLEWAWDWSLEWEGLDGMEGGLGQLLELWPRLLHL